VARINRAVVCSRFRPEILIILNLADRCCLIECAMQLQFVLELVNEDR
jgi:hypothetical protein